MASEADKAVDLLRQLLTDDGANDVLSDTNEDISTPKNHSSVNTDSGSENLISVFSDDKTTEQQDARFDLNALLSSGIFQTLLSGNGDRRVDLLKALKPCLSEKRGNRVESAITLMQIINMSSTFGLDKLFK